MSFLSDIWNALAGAVMWVAAAMGFGQSAPDQFQGYVEAEYVRVAVNGAGTLTTLKVARGDKLVAGAPLFTLDDTAERAARDEATARLNQAAAQIDDLLKGKRPPEIDAILAQQAQAEAALRSEEHTSELQSHLNLV